VVHRLDDGRVGRFGWKANIPSVREFVRDALSNEVGLTVPAEAGLTFGFTSDSDGIGDPEIGLDELDALEYFLLQLAPPAQQADAATAASGLAIFEDIGCASCHVPALEGADGPVPLYSDLLLHAVGPSDRPGIPDGAANQDQFRTPPLWGLSNTAPYLHDGSATTVEAAIRAHEGEASASRLAFETLDADDVAALIAFLEAL
jgi:CxxC motif-containing protein (DUF1111 family)